MSAFLSSRWLRSPQHDDPEIQLRARILHWIALVSIVTVGPLAALLPVLDSTYAHSLPLYLVALGGVVACYSLLHLGMVTAASVSLSILAWLVTIWASFASGGVASPQLSMGVLAIMLAGMLLSGWGALAMALAIASSLIGVEILRDVGLMPEPFIEGTRITVWAALSSVLVLSAVLLQLYVNSMRAAREEAVQATRRLEAEMERHLATEASLRTAERLEALGRLTGGIAHDFNNILMILQGENELLRLSADRGQHMSSGEIQHIEQIERSIDRAAALTRQLLAFSKQQPGTPDHVEVGQALDRLESLLNRLIRADVKLTITNRLGAAGVCIVASQLDQILMNLALNASDAMPGGGELIIVSSLVTVGDEARDFNPESEPGEFVCIEVTDNGEGIAPENLELIFDPFFTTKSVGTGLGLASAHGIVALAGGFVRIQSQLGIGTTVRVYLPKDNSKSTAVVSDQVLEREGKPSRILLCEDDPEVRLVTERLLASAGHEVVAVSSAEVALSWLQQDSNPLDLLISDVILSGMSGAEMAREAMDRRPNLPVLLISGYTADVLHDQGIAEDMELLHKPFRGSVLLERASALIRNWTKVTDQVVKQA